MSVLKVDHITINFGGLIAVDDFSLEMNKGDLFAIIGPNGAGKTTPRRARSMWTASG